MMKFEIPRCPTCGLLAEGTLDCVPGVAQMEFDAVGNAEYSGQTIMWWDDQYTETDGDKNVTLLCEDGHRWQSLVEDIES